MERDDTADIIHPHAPEGLCLLLYDLCIFHKRLFHAESNTSVNGLSLLAASAVPDIIPSTMLSANDMLRKRVAFFICLFPFRNALI